MKKKLTLKKLTVASMDENMMRSIRGGDYYADTYNDKCTNYCDTGGPACTVVPCGNTNDCQSMGTECEGPASQEGPVQCHTDGQCTITHCTLGCPKTYNDATC